LADTIDENTGFRFSEFSSAALLDAIRRACHAWSDPLAWTVRMKAGMQKDFSWKCSAREYSRLYDELMR
jgi:starch synthase